MIFHDTGVGNPTLLHKIIQAWKKVHTKGTELGKKNCVAKEPYRQWVIERVQEVNFPFTIELPTLPTSPEPIPISIEEVDKLKPTILRLEKEKEGLQANLNWVSHERNKLRFNLDQR